MIIVVVVVDSFVISVVGVVVVGVAKDKGMSTMFDQVDLARK